mgnify:CR=1 FL=1
MNSPTATTNPFRRWARLACERGQATVEFALILPALLLLIIGMVDFGKGVVVPYRDLLEEILARHTGQSRERVHADTDRDFVMEASEALAYGIIDDVISSRQMVDRTGPIR